MSDEVGVKRVCVTGSRWAIEKHRERIREALEDFMPFEVLVHGGAPGVDSIAALIAQELGARTECYPAAWSKYGRSAGPKRNRDMAAAGIDIAAAFPLGGEENRGTWDCVRALVDQAIQVWVTPLEPLTEEERKRAVIRSIRDERMG